MHSTLTLTGIWLESWLKVWNHEFSIKQNLKQTDFKFTGKSWMKNHEWKIICLEFCEPGWLRCYLLNSGRRWSNVPLKSPNPSNPQITKPLSNGFLRSAFLFLLNPMLSPFTALTRLFLLTYSLTSAPSSPKYPWYFQFNCFLPTSCFSSLIFTV